MKKLSRQMMIIGTVIVAFMAVFATIIGIEITQYHQGEEYLPPSPEQEPCQHCHISGSEENPSTPINRWVSFGLMGLIFTFGITRNLSVWKNHEEWQHRWRSKLGKFIPYIFLLQAITGIVLVFFAKPMPEALLDTPLSFDFVIRAIHWGSAILLFVITLAYSFIGTQLSWYPRAYWATIFIIALAFGIPAISKLSLAYLRADWVISLSSNQVYTLHLLLIPAMITSLIDVIANKEKSNG